MHNGLASLLAEGILKVGAIVLAQEVSRNRLTTVLVDSLKDLVASGVSQTREQGNKLPAGGCAGLVLEDDLVQLASIGNLEVCWSMDCSLGLTRDLRYSPYTRLVAHQSLRNGVDLDYC